MRLKVDYHHSVFILTRTQKDSFIGDRQFTEFYTSSWMNFGCYFCGVLAALVYDQLSLKQYKLRELKSFQLLWFTLIPVGILWMFSAHPIFQHYYVAPSAIWGALYAGLQRNIWGFGLGIFIVGMASKVGCKYGDFGYFPLRFSSSFIHSSHRDLS